MGDYVLRTDAKGGQAAREFVGGVQYFAICVPPPFVDQRGVIGVGCLDFVEPEPGPGSLEADLAIRSEGPRAAFRARFRPGGDADVLDVREELLVA
ncbi:MAG: hypothetical protein ABEH64_12630, partial [Salinirussus sp.]